MEIPREQFDELLGGTEQLPSVISITKFANARSQEIIALTEAIEEPQNKHLAFQKMPKHLRRRAMSHNVKRMPRRLQDIHLSQMEKSGLPTKGKRPSRKYRRKPSNLLMAFNRRQLTAMWLETHIWHAKRFHMTELWGYKLPNYPNDKSFRACYRATAKHCLIQDMSFLNCIELQGPEADILQRLSQLTSPECGLTFAAKSTINGNRQGNVTVFKKGKYPFNAIGRVSFMWRPEQKGHMRTIWIWSHPAFYSEFLQELISVFEFKEETTSEMECDPVVESGRLNKLTAKEEKVIKKSQNAEEVKTATRNIGKLPKFSSLNSSITMYLLKDTLNRFRLTGPLAQVVLTEALQFVKIDSFIKGDRAEDKMMEVDGEERPRSEWLPEYYSNQDCLNSLKQQKAFWESILPDINSANELPPNIIVAATVMDPRLSMPSSRIKAVNTGVCDIQPEIPENLRSNCPLWVEAWRDAATRSKMSVNELNRLRSRALVPGLATAEWIGYTNVSHLPIMLVQNPGAKREDLPLGYGSGWDLIVPAGWGMPVWMGLVFRGARPGGLRETEKLTVEAASGPVLPPDSSAGQALSEHYRKQLEAKHFKLPPDKRPNYVKLGIVSPFNCPWVKLLKDWFPEEEDKGFFVLRNRTHLDYLSCLLNKTKPVGPCSFTATDKQCGLVQVGIEMCGRGTVKQFSLICAPEKEDLVLVKKNKSGRGPIEWLHEDVNEEQRTTLRNAHKAKLKKLRRKRVRAKRELEENGVFATKEDTKVNPTEELVKKQAEVIKELWLPQIEAVKSSSSRSVMGFVTCGDYSFTRSQEFGYGFVALSALLTILEQKKSYVLVRNIMSLQYNFARIKLLYPV